MKEIFKSKKWIAFFLALFLVVVTCINSSDAFLRATDGDEATSEQAESGPAEEMQHVEVVESNEESAPEVETNPEEAASPTVDEGQPADPDAEQNPDPGTVEEGAPDAEQPEGGQEQTPAAGNEEAVEGEEAEEELVEEELVEEELLEEEIIEEVERSVKVVSSLAGVETVEEGTPITLTAELTGFDDVEYEIQWQRSTDGADWEDVDGANGIEYTFDITEETDGYLWRVGVFISEA